MKLVDTLMREKCQMQENEPVEKKRNNISPLGGPPRKNVPFPFDSRVRAVKLHFEEGCTHHRSRGAGRSKNGLVGIAAVAEQALAPTKTRSCGYSYS
jgi:hypothetical protein